MRQKQFSDPESRWPSLATVMYIVFGLLWTLKHTLLGLKQNYFLWFFFSSTKHLKKTGYYAGVSWEWCFHTWNVWCFHTCFHTLLDLGYSMRSLWRCKAGMMLEDCWGWREQNLVPWCLYCLLELIPAWAIPPAKLRHRFSNNWHKPNQPGSMLADKQCGWSPGQCSSLFLALVLFSSMERAEISTHPGIRLPGELQTLGLIDWDTWQHIALMQLCNIVFH